MDRGPYHHDAPDQPSSAVLQSLADKGLIDAAFQQAQKMEEDVPPVIITLPADRQQEMEKARDESAQSIELFRKELSSVNPSQVTGNAIIASFSLISSALAKQQETSQAMSTWSLAVAEKFADHHHGMAELMATKADYRTIEKVVEGIVSTNFKIDTEVRARENSEKMIEMIKKNSDEAMKFGTSNQIDLKKMETKCRILESTMNAAKDLVERRTGEAAKLQEQANMEIAINGKVDRAKYELQTRIREEAAEIEKMKALIEGERKKIENIALEVKNGLKEITKLSTLEDRVKNMVIEAENRIRTQTSESLDEKFNLMERAFVGMKDNKETRNLRSRSKKEEK